VTLHSTPPIIEYTRPGRTRRFLHVMKNIEKIVSESGKIGYALLWLIGIPLPILLIIFLIRGH
jgi:hypothetical protein